jgi:hypothetical protein
MRIHRRFATAAFTVAAGFAAVVAATPAARAGLLEVPLDAALTPGALPTCDDPSVIADVQERFAAGAVGALNTDLSLVTVGRIRQTHPVVTKPSPVARRFCAAQGLVSNGHKASVYFLIEQRLGYAGLGWLVTSCVNGYEAWRTSGGNCRAVRRWW